jgi:hypothetical protein
MFSSILSAAALLFAVLGPKFFHSDHGQATMQEIEAALIASATVTAAAEAPQPAAPIAPAPAPAGVSTAALHSAEKR